jgi:hypothetical protein
MKPVPVTERGFTGYVVNDSCDDWPLVLFAAHAMPQPQGPLTALLALCDPFAGASVRPSRVAGAGRLLRLARAAGSGKTECWWEPWF